MWLGGNVPWQPHTAAGKREVIIGRAVPQRVGGTVPARDTRIGDTMISTTLLALALLTQAPAPQTLQERAQAERAQQIDQFIDPSDWLSSWSRSNTS